MTDLPDIEDRIRAVTTFDKNIVVTAGAGTGKTSLLVERIIHLLMREPSPLKITEIVALTFTNKAAAEMKIRLKDRLLHLIHLSNSQNISAHEDPVLLDIMNRYRLSRDRIDGLALDAINNLEKAQIGTIHSFAGYILRLYPIEAGIDPKFKEDDGSEFEEHFEREWEGWLDIELSSDSPHRGLWKTILNKMGLESLKSFAKEICKEAIPIRILKQITARQGLSDELQRWLEWHKRKVQYLLSEYRKSRKIEQLLDKAYEVFDGVLSKRDISIIIDDIPSGPPPAGWSEEDYREARMSINAARRLLSADNTLINNLLELLLPFVTDCRQRFIASGNMSFDGLLTFCRDLLKTRPKILEELKKRFKAILVDEFQDTDPVQYEIVLYLSEVLERHEVNWRNIQLARGKLFIVGDPKQSIYAFRRADIEAYSRVVEMILSDDGGIKADLSTSFRTHNKIINVVNELFSRMIIQRELLQPGYVNIIGHPGCRSSLPIHRVELRIVDGREGSDIDASTATRLEAEAIGKWLKVEMLGKENIMEPPGNRAVLSPRHVAILLRKLTDVYEYIEALRRYDIPYIVEGERHFYATQEVIDFVNLLRAIDNPCDRLSLVGVLRSPLGGLSDREIYELNRLSLLDYRVPEESLENALNNSLGLKRSLIDLNGLNGLYGLLKRLNTEIGARPVSDAINYIFETLPVLEFAASSFHGEQAIANLLKIQKIAESLSDRADITLKGFTTLLEKRVVGLEEEGESLLSEETVDAVRILSIHKAKGLEFPVVILAGIHSSQKSGEDHISVMYDWSSDEIGFKVDDLRNPVAVMLYERRTIRGEEEQKRLLYVAMTRARECLVLSGTLYGRGNRDSFLSMIRDVIGTPLGDKFISEIVIGEGKIMQSIINHSDCVPQYISRRLQKLEVRSQKSPSPSINRSEDIEMLSDLWRLRNNRYEAISEKMLFVTPSRLEDKAVRLSGKVGEITDEMVVERNRAILIGTMSHYILEHWGFENDTSLFKDAVEDVCLKFTPTQFITEISSIRDELERMFDSFSISPAYEELKRVDIIGREVPFTIPWDGQIMEGVIDLIYQDGNRIFVADYKTDKVMASDIEDKIKEYTLSGHIYKEAVRRCLNVDVAGFKLIFIRIGNIVSLKLT